MGNTHGDLNKNNYLEYQNRFDTSHPEYKNYLSDFNEYPLWEPYESEYRGIKYSIMRIRISHLCGYVKYDDYDIFTKDEIREIEQESCHFEFTSGFGGFDCAHYYSDYKPNPFPVSLGNETYKNFEYVEDVIKKIIDHMYRLKPNLNLNINNNNN